MFDPTGVSIAQAISFVVLLVGVVATLIYFYFSVEHKGTVASISKVGITFLMIGFGATFGYNVMGRISLLIGRFQFIFAYWLHIIK
jgi:hypothetical protein